jgi:hypothetical protein
VAVPINHTVLNGARPNAHPRTPGGSTSGRERGTTPGSSGSGGGSGGEPKSTSRFQNAFGKGGVGLDAATEEGRNLLGRKSKFEGEAIDAGTEKVQRCCSAMLQCYAAVHRTTYSRASIHCIHTLCIHTLRPYTVRPCAVHPCAVQVLEAFDKLEKREEMTEKMKEVRIVYGVWCVWCIWVWCMWVGGMWVGRMMRGGDVCLEV